MMTQRHVNGFVLIEAIIAILILGVCLVSLAAGLDRLSGAFRGPSAAGWAGREQRRYGGGGTGEHAWCGQIGGQTALSPYLCLPALLLRK